MYNETNTSKELDKQDELKDNTYIGKNRGYVTASKLKYFLTYGPEAYKLKYIDEVVLDEEDEEDDDKTHFLVGNAYDDLLSYGREYFEEKYYIDEGLKVDQLKAVIGKENLLGNEKLEDLRKILYGDKIRLTKGLGKSILGMYRETMRQPLADMNGQYLHQQEIMIEYEGIPLRMVLDRISVENALIRDWKTSGNLDKFEYNIETTFDYILSMAFYYIGAKIKYGVSCDVILDVLGKTKPYPYIGYKLNKDDLFNSVENKIKPGLKSLKECMDTGIRESVYPINYQTENRYGDIISYKKGEPIARTKLMTCEYYHLLKGSIAKDFVQPMF